MNKELKLKIISRNSPLDDPVVPKDYGPMEHNMEKPVIAVCFDLQALTDEMLALYKKRDLVNERHDPNRSE